MREAGDLAVVEQPQPPGVIASRQPPCVAEELPGVPVIDLGGVIVRDAEGRSGVAQVLRRDTDMIQRRDRS